MSFDTDRNNNIAMSNHEMSENLLKPAEHWFLLFAVALAMLLGGGVTSLGFAVYGQAALALILLITMGTVGNRPKNLRLSILEICLIATILLLPLLQLIPLPAEIWKALPGRELDESVRRALRTDDRAYPISIVPSHTVAMLLPLYSVAVLGFATLIAGGATQRHIMVLLVAFAFLNVTIGGMQVVTGGEYLNFYNSGHGANAIGLFANRNHTALFLAGSIPLFNHLIFSSGLINKSNARLILAVAGTAFLFTGIIATTSRAGLILGCLSLGTTLLLAVSFRRSERKLGIGVSFFVCAALLLMLILLTSDRMELVWQRFSSASSDLRWEIWANSMIPTAHFWPIGSGFGTFSVAYERFQPLSDVLPQFVNNAHNDYIELALEAGLVGVGLIVAMLIWLIVRSAQILRQGANRTLASPAIPMLLMAWLVMLHSAVDYPMRRLAIAVPCILALVIVRQYALASNGTVLEPDSKAT
jgi:O-antigen ligase